MTNEEILDKNSFYKSLNEEIEATSSMWFILEMMNLAREEGRSEARQELYNLVHNVPLTMRNDFGGKQ